MLKSATQILQSCVRKKVESKRDETNVPGSNCLRKFIEDVVSHVIVSFENLEKMRGFMFQKCNTPLLESIFHKQLFHKNINK